MLKAIFALYAVSYILFGAAIVRNWWRNAP